MPNKIASRRHFSDDFFYLWFRQANTMWIEIHCDQIFSEVQLPLLAIWDFVVDEPTRASYLEIIYTCVSGESHQVAHVSTGC